VVQIKRYPECSHVVLFYRCRS